MRSRYLGVTGLGGHERVIDFHRERPPARTLVLGTRLGEMSSFWEEALCPSQGFVHVDVDSSVFGRAFPRVPTVGVQADVETFLSELLAAWPAKRAAVVAAPFHEPAARGEAPGELATDQKPDPAQRGVLVRPSYLLGRVQEIIVDGTDGIVLTEAGNAFALGSHFLRFDEAGRYRVSTSFGSMGHAAAGVLGATLGSGRKAFAILGDGAMLMQNELNTAASCDIDAVWIVLNDARYGMIAQGMESVGWEPFGTDFVRTDFVAIARGMGADGVTVHDECEIDSALRRAVAAKGPFVVDVMIDPRERAPAIGRNQSLIAQGVNGRSL